MGPWKSGLDYFWKMLVVVAIDFKEGVTDERATFDKAIQD